MVDHNFSIVLKYTLHEHESLVFNDVARKQSASALTRNAAAELVWVFVDEVVVDAVFERAEDDDGSRVLHCNETNTVHDRSSIWERVTTSKTNSFSHTFLFDDSLVRSHNFVTS